MGCIPQHNCCLSAEFLLAAWEWAVLSFCSVPTTTPVTILKDVFPSTADSLIPCDFLVFLFLLSPVECINKIFSSLEVQVKRSGLVWQSEIGRD